MTANQIQSQINSIKNQLIKKYKPQKIILFGSAVSGDMSADSDLDFLVVKDDRRMFHERLTGLYRIVKKEIAADFIVYTPSEIEEKIKLGDPFILSVLSKGKVLYG